MKNDDEIIDSIIIGGLIGATLGTLISQNKATGSIVGALAGAALLATFKANEVAMHTNLPFYIEENGFLYEVNANGEKKIIKKIEKSTKHLPLKFKLK